MTPTLPMPPRPVQPRPREGRRGPIPARPAALAALAAAASCAGSAEPPSCALGTGTDAWIRLEDGDPLDVHRGSQGGYHVFGGVRVRGIEPGDPVHYDPDNPVIEFSVYRDGQPIDVSEPLPLGLSPVEGGEYEVVGRAVVLDNAAILPVEGLEGAELEFEVAVEGADGSSCADRVRVVARLVD